MKLQSIVYIVDSLKIAIDENDFGTAKQVLDILENVTNDNKDIQRFVNKLFMYGFDIVENGKEDNQHTIRNFETVHKVFHKVMKGLY